MGVKPKIPCRTFDYLEKKELKSRLFSKNSDLKFWTPIRVFLLVSSLALLHGFVDLPAKALDHAFESLPVPDGSGVLLWPLAQPSLENRRKKALGDPSDFVYFGQIFKGLKCIPPEKVFGQLGKIPFKQKNRANNISSQNNIKTYRNKKHIPAKIQVKSFQQKPV